MRQKMKYLKWKTMNKLLTVIMAFISLIAAIYFIEKGKDADTWGWFLFVAMWLCFSLRSKNDE